MGAVDKHQVALEEFLTFHLGGEEYAIDILQVQEIRAHENVTRIANAPEFIKGVINLRGSIVPIVDLRLKFGMPATQSKLPVVIILSIARQVIGVVVDAVSDVVGLAAEQIRPAPEVGGAIAGFIRGIAPIDTRMLILVDIERLMRSDEVALISQTAAKAA
jgi:purine-binding chemotaxis protein CheW